MAIQNLKEFTNQWVLFGLLFFCLISFAIIFMANNNPGGFGGAEENFNDLGDSMGSNLIGLENSSNILLNISAQNNPEVSNLGSQDSVATSYGMMGSGKSFFQSFKLFLGWIITGAIGKMLVAIFAGMFGMTALYFVTKWIRNGL